MIMESNVVKFSCEDWLVEAEMHILEPLTKREKDRRTREVFASLREMLREADLEVTIAPSSVKEIAS